MSTTPTVNFGWLKPVPGTEVDTWGPIINEIFDDIDAKINTLGTNRGVTTPFDFGAVGDGIANDTTAVQAAINTNKKVDGLGFTFGVTGIALRNNSWLENIKFKQLAPHAALEVRTIWADGVNNTRMNYVSVDKNGDGYGGELSGGGSAGAFIRNSSGNIWKNVDITGSDRGHGVRMIAPINDSIFEEIYVHDMFWEEPFATVTIAQGSPGIITWPNHPLGTTRNVGFEQTGGGIDANKIYFAIPLPSDPLNKFTIKAGDPLYGNLAPIGPEIDIGPGVISPQVCTQLFIDDAASGISISGLARCRILNCSVKNIGGAPSRDRTGARIGHYYGKIINPDGTRGTPIVSAINDNATSTYTVQLAADASNVLDYYKYNAMFVVAGKGKGLANRILGNTTGRSCTFGVSWNETLDSTSRVIIRSTQWSRGIEGGGGNNSIIRDFQSSFVDQGCDITAGNAVEGGHRHFMIQGGSASDCSANGWKFAHVQKHLSVANTQAIRCGIWGFVCGSEDTGGDLELDSCISRDTGYGSAIVNARGFHISSPKGVHLNNCVAHSEVGNMAYGFLYQPLSGLADPLDPVSLTNCKSTGATVADIQGPFVINPSSSRGSVTQPAVSIGGDQDTGFYSEGENSVAIAVGGHKVASWSTTLIEFGGLTVDDTRMASLDLGGKFVQKYSDNGLPTVQRYENVGITTGNTTGHNEGVARETWMGHKGAGVVPAFNTHREDFMALDTMADAAHNTSQMRFMTTVAGANQSFWIGPLGIKTTRIFTNNGNSSLVLATASNLTYTILQLYMGMICRNPSGAARIDTLPDAALIWTQNRGWLVNDEMSFFVSNMGLTPAETITIAPGTGGVLGTGLNVVSTTIPAGSGKLIKIRATNVTLGAEAYVVWM